MCFKIKLNLTEHWTVYISVNIFLLLLLLQFVNNWELKEQTETEGLNQNNSKAECDAKCSLLICYLLLVTCYSVIPCLFFYDPINSLVDVLIML